ncbi:MAG TPA: serine/threonine-protein kinase [Pseudobdellovibrionaceae bacterium]|nr:serine/threonine-protein kinase [Pseudobdellovibrionaceae bacterium]
MSNPFETFGKYTLLEKIASGGMAEVYLSNLKAAGGVNKFVGIKRILPQFSDNQEFINMFKEEAKIAVNLNHSNIVSIFDFGIEKKQFYLVMEYVEGKNLRQVLNELKKQNQYFTLEQIIYIAKETAAGLDHAHRCIDGATGKPLNITHRDMSPQNIMVSYEGEVKIIDFGIAKAETQLEATRAGTLKGKFGYMSPEQADGYPVDSRTDIFSLGIVVWELLANTRLFSGSSEPEILRKIKDCQIPSLRKLNPNIPAELEKIVLKALVKDKNLRYQTAAAFHRDLNRFLNTQYPEFSTHDFSIFIKTILAQFYQSQRKKMIEFATQAFGEQPSLKTAEVNPNSQALKDHNSGLFDQLSKNFDGSDFSSTEIESNEHSIEPSVVKLQKNNYKIKIPDATSITSLPTDSRSKSAYSSLNSEGTSAESQVWQNESFKKKSSSSSYFYVILFILGGISLLFYSQKNNPKFNNWKEKSFINLASTAAVKVVIESDQPDTEISVFNSKGIQESSAFVNNSKIKNTYELAIEQDYKVIFKKSGFQEYVFILPLKKAYESQFLAGAVEKNITIKLVNKIYTVSAKMTPETNTNAPLNLSIQSDPPGATVFINTTKTETLTPQVASIQESKDFTILLRKEGFLDYSTLISPSENVATLNVPLIKSTEAGQVKLVLPLASPSVLIYIQSKVRNSIFSQKIFFNGPGPYEFAIPALTKVNITVTNPFNGSAGSMEVQVSPQSKNSYELFLESK